MTMNLDVQQHPALLEQLTAAYPNSIRVLPSTYPINRYTCLMHVLDFTEKPNYIAIATYPGINVFAGPEFAHWLVDKGYLTEVSEAQAAAGDLVMYFNEGNFKHIGILQEDARVVSKWGEGHLYEHALWEVPESYGESVRFFRPLAYDDAYEYFTQFAEEHGIPFEYADS
jgi:hypothetical protein